jgi:hypothetical protein
MGVHPPLEQGDAASGLLYGLGGFWARRKMAEQSQPPCAGARFVKRWTGRQRVAAEIASSVVQATSVRIGSTIPIKRRPYSTYESYISEAEAVWPVWITADK